MRICSTDLQLGTLAESECRSEHARLPLLPCGKLLELLDVPRLNGDERLVPVVLHVSRSLGLEEDERNTVRNPFSEEITE